MSRLRCQISWIVPVSPHRGLCYFLNIFIQTDSSLIKSWTGTHFEKTDLFSLGLHVQLGHDGGMCDSPTEPSSLLAFHPEGVTTLSVMYCGCRTTAAESKPVQLLRSRLYPSSLKKVKTVFTFDVLDYFQELNLQAKTTAYDYYNTLLGKADRLKLGKQPVRLLFHLTSSIEI